MSDLAHSTTLECWRGERGTYHLVTISGADAEVITHHERLHRLEFGARRGFGSVKVMARIGGTRWKTSVFPSTPTSPSSGQGKDLWLLVGKTVLRAEDLAEGDLVTVDLDLL
ncbi:DUF1905 domain-containing protein [Tsuneonella sp. HG094]